MNQSDTIEKLAEALAKAQGAIKNADKDSTNPHFKSKYADLASVWGACREALSANGLSVIQTSGGGPETVKITTRLLHESGQWIQDTLELRPQQSTPQGIGSAVTYGKRYSLMGMVGIAPDDDDDGQAASQPYSQAARPAPPAPRKPQPVPAAGIPDEQDIKKSLLEQITNLAKIAKLDKHQTIKVLGINPATASVDELDAGKGNLTAFNNRFINKLLTAEDRALLSLVSAAS